MSTKRGRRNGKWHKEKSNRRLQELRDDLHSKSREVEYIPLEKPIFAGWDVTMSINCVRRDAKELQAVVDIMKWSEDFYVKDVKHIRSIRRYGHTYESYIKLKKSYYDHSNYIREHVYCKLPQNIKDYFTPITSYYGGILYSLKWNFPFYAFTVKIKKSYFYFKKVYNTAALSEYEKLDARLYTVDVKGWGRYRDSYAKQNKAAYDSSLRKIISHQYKPEEIIDDYFEIFKGTNNKRDYGWD